MDTVVEVAGLTRTYRPVHGWLRAVARTGLAHPVVALDGVDLVLRAGETVTVVGPNGAGKTTLFEVLAGLGDHDHGHVRVLGRDPVTDPSARGLVGWMPGDDRSLLHRLTCRENLTFHARLRGLDRADRPSRVDAMLAAVGLHDRADDTVSTLSSGMRARLQLARALLHRPRLLLLDEPTASVDPLAAPGLLDLVTALVADHGAAALIATHRLEDVTHLGGRILLLDRGRVLHDGDLASLEREFTADGLTEVLARAYEHAP